LKLSDLLKVYSLDPLLQSLHEELKNSSGKAFALKGLKGSSDSIIAATLYSQSATSQLFILKDKEEANYFANDLQHLVQGQDVLVFPSSYKKPYEFEETDNANVLLRAEVLNRLNIKDKKGELVVTYPEALTEKVISKKTLIENTMVARVGEQLDVNFISELLNSYDFEKTDFVYEAGQFSIRGGIVDIFSFANELPYRLELFGNEIESIRTFDPNTQLSVDSKAAVSIIPNVQNKMVLSSTESLLNFFPANALIWTKDMELVKEVLEDYFARATAEYEKQKNINTSLIGKPEERFETYDNFYSQASKFVLIEFGNKFSKSAKVYEFSTHPQPPFNKDFNLLSKSLAQNQDKGFTNLIATESLNQFEKLNAILEEIDPFVKIQQLSFSLREGFLDDNIKIACYTDHQIFDRFYRYKSKEKHSKSKAITLKELRTLQPGDYVTHADYGIAKFVGLEKVQINGVQQEAIRLLFKDNDLMKVSILALHKISKYSGKEGEVPTMSKLGSQDWDNKKKAVKKKVKEIAIDLIGLYAKRKAAPGFAFTKDNYLQAELETSFLYEDTPDQAKATEDVKADMQKPHPMDRLVCGDVGFGKTEVAVRAAFKAACDGKQVAVLVPTTILAMQHYKTFKERLEKFPVRVEYVSRFRTTSQIKETLKRVEEGKTEILIGTHRILSKDVKFKNIGLLIIDEEQKFGVAAKEKLKELKVNVDTLTLTATPIPRTLHFSLMGARDLSIIATPPPNRQPVTTEVHTFNEALIRDAVSHEIKRGGQVFFVHNRISDLYMLADMIKRLVPDCKVAVGHGQMEGEELETIMVKFISGECDVLVSTTIVESGLDIPNANTMIINQAHHFGLSDLHQMRGRVGRSNKKAYCYLLTPPKDGLSGDSKKKLSALEEFSDLGDGFKVAMRDLDIRGAGNLLGGEQTGFITDIGFEMYHKLLDEAIQELKEHEFKALFEHEIKVKDLTPDCSIETDLAILIPEEYVTNISERLGLYNELDNLENEESLQKFIARLIDRFGPLPQEVLDLTETVKLRWTAEKIGFDKLSIKAGLMKCQFAATSDKEYFNGETFGKILDFVQKNPKSCNLKELKDKLIINVDGIKTISQAFELLEKWT
jgi:transcription-repair coupling factor (superfamily II helicase)